MCKVHQSRDSITSTVYSAVIHINNSCLVSWSFVRAHGTCVTHTHRKVLRSFPNVFGEIRFRYSYMRSLWASRVSLSMRVNNTRTFTLEEFLIQKQNACVFVLNTDCTAEQTYCTRSTHRRITACQGISHNISCLQCNADKTPITHHPRPQLRIPNTKTIRKFQQSKS